MQLWAIDPKGGVELAFGAPIFTRFAYAEVESARECYLRYRNIIPSPMSPDHSKLSQIFTPRR